MILAHGLNRRSAIGQHRPNESPLIVGSAILHEPFDVGAVRPHPFGNLAVLEIAANPSGLGYAIISAGLSLRPEDMYAFLVWLAILGWLLNVGLIAAHRRLFGNAYGEVPT
jgi:hypothetical protein